jgi:hypothetical protein
MANVASALRTKLLEASELTTLIGQRMYIDVLNQNSALPAVVCRRISTQPVHVIDDLTLLSSSRIEFTCYAIRRKVADDIARAIRRSGIFSFRGVVDGITFCGARLDSGDEGEDEPPTDGNQVHRYLTRFDLMVDYKEES